MFLLSFYLSVNIKKKSQDIWLIALQEKKKLVEKLMINPYMENDSNEWHVIVEFKLYQIQYFTYTIVWRNTVSIFNFPTILAICQWIVAGRWLCSGTPVSSINKTDHHDVTEILLKVALNIITHPPVLADFWKGGTENSKHQLQSSKLGGSPKPVAYKIVHRRIKWVVPQVRRACEKKSYSFKSSFHKILCVDI
jgi:hypothetical protein